jgi:Flp pilus assembly protein TadB
MPCPRCSADTPSWCSDCEGLYDTWSRQYAADIVWQTGTGALVAMVIGLGAMVLGLTPVLGIVGVLAGATTFIGLRKVSNRRRRQQFITTSVPRAYLPTHT